jgi:uncharacterized membrane protein
MYPLLYISTLLPMVLIDAVWLFATASYYKKWMGSLFASSPNFAPAIVFYLLYAAGIVFFVLAPAIKSGGTLMNVIVAGMLFGLVAYGTYDLTNHATLNGWPYFVTFIDMAWGMVVTAASSAIAYMIYIHTR